MSTAHEPQGTEQIITPDSAIQPMGWGLSLVCFGIPSLMQFLIYYAVTPQLMAIGWLPFYAELIPGCMMLASMLAAALVGYRLEGRSLSWTGMKDRFRLHRVSGKLWLWILGGIVVLFFLQGLGEMASQWLIDQNIMPIPASIPDWSDPRISFSVTERFDRGFGGLRNNWLALLVAITVFVLNLLGEEFWWRGYILPRQELAFGKSVWLIHGIMWAAIFHAALYWRILGLIPADLLLVYLAWRTRNNTTLFIIHGIQLFTFPLAVGLGVLGVPL